MARMRTIKPEFWTDDEIVDLDLLPKLLYIGLWNFADDDGYIEASARRIKRLIFPDNDYDVAGALEALLSSGRIGEFDSDQGRVFKILRFKEHQRPQHPTATKYTNIRAVSGSPHEDSGEVLSPHSVEESSGGESSEGSTAVRGARIPESFSITDDMRAWATTHAALVDLDLKLPEFIDYWRGVPGAKGVKVDWVGTWRNSMRKQQGFAEADRAKRPKNTDWALRG